MIFILQPQICMVCSLSLTERNHNIRIPGFASDMTPIAVSQAGAAPTTQTTQSTKKGAQGTQNSLRAHRLAQVAQAKREAKLM
jgi:transcription initiation factor TFIID subunit 12